MCWGQGTGGKRIELFSPASYEVLLFPGNSYTRQEDCISGGSAKGRQVWEPDDEMETVRK